MFNKIKRHSNNAKQNYSAEVQKYLKTNGFHWMKKIYDCIVESEELNEEKIKTILGERYPISNCVAKDDIRGQFICILSEAGYNCSYNEMGKIYFKKEEVYSAMVKNHLLFSGKEILEKLGDCCEKTNGRISYEQMHEILGVHYPKAPYALGADDKICMVLFLREVNLVFKFDETHIYFP